MNLTFCHLLSPLFLVSSIFSFLVDFSINMQLCSCLTLKYTYVLYQPCYPLCLPCLSFIPINRLISIPPYLFTTQSLIKFCSLTCAPVTPMPPCCPNPVEISHTVHDLSSAFNPVGHPLFLKTLLKVMIPRFPGFSHASLSNSF